MGLSESCLQASRQADVNFSALRPQDLSMESDLARSLGYFPKSVSEGLQQLI